MPPTSLQKEIGTAITTSTAGRPLPHMFHSGPARSVHIPKSSGGVRRLEIPSVVDRMAQAAELALDPITGQKLRGY